MSAYEVFAGAAMVTLGVLAVVGAVGGLIEQRRNRREPAEDDSGEPDPATEIQALADHAVEAAMHESCRRLGEAPDPDADRDAGDRLRAALAMHDHCTRGRRAP